MDVHLFYDMLTEKEREFVDVAFRQIFKDAKATGIHLLGDDRAEIAVDALSKLIIESRGKHEKVLRGLSPHPSV
jgi:hypothetical protein